MIEEQPFVSVIMPIRNEGSAIAQSLGAVLSQDYPHDRLEVLIADGMSTDQTREIVGRLRLAHPDVAVQVLDNPAGIVPTGFNKALRASRGEVVVRVDGHTVIARDYVRECVAALARSGADNVGGAMVASSERSFGRAAALATSCPFGVGGARFHYSRREEWVDTVYLGCWRKAIFDRIGGFDEEMVRNQDDEFNYRLASAGGRVLLSPRIQSVYFNRTSIRRLWRQYFQYGYWKVRVMQKHPAQIRARHFAPACFVAALGAAAVAALWIPGGWRAVVLLGGAYLVADLCASVWAARKGEWRLVPLLGIVFPTMHAAYGSGFWTGLFRFAGLWRFRRTPVPMLAGSRGPENGKP